MSENKETLKLFFIRNYWYEDEDFDSNNNILSFHNKEDENTYTYMLSFSNSKQEALF